MFQIETGPNLLPLHPGGLGTDVKTMWDRVPPETKAFDPEKMNSGTRPVLPWGNARFHRKDFRTKEIEDSWTITQNKAIKRFISCYNCPQQCGALIDYPDVPRYMMISRPCG